MAIMEIRESGDSASQEGAYENAVQGDPAVLLQKSVRSCLWTWTGDRMFLPHKANPVFCRAHHSGVGDCGCQALIREQMWGRYHENYCDRKSEDPGLFPAAPL